MQGFRQRKDKMKSRLSIAASTLLAALALSSHAALAEVAAVSPAHGFAPHQVVVKLAGSRPRTVVLPQQASVRAAVTALRGDPAVSYASPNFVATASAKASEVTDPVPNDPGPIGGQLGPPGGWVYKQWSFLPWEGAPTPLVPVSPGGIDVVGAWENLEATRHPGAQGVTVAVLDSGIAYRSKPPASSAAPTSPPTSSSPATTSSTTTSCRSTNSATAPTWPARSPRRRTTASAWSASPTGRS